jgi:hypothetical protein
MALGDLTPQVFEGPRERPRAVAYGTSFVTGPTTMRIAPVALILLGLSFAGCAAEEEPDPTHGDIFPDGYVLTVHVTSPVAFDELRADLRAGEVRYPAAPTTMYDYLGAFLAPRDHASFTALLDRTPVAVGEVKDLRYERVGNGLDAEVSLTLTPFELALAAE